jgi:hypothetical protein
VKQVAEDDEPTKSISNAAITTEGRDAERILRIDIRTFVA